MKTEIVHVGNTQAQFSEVADIKLSPVVRQIIPGTNFMPRVNLMWKNKYEEEKA